MVTTSLGTGPKNTVILGETHLHSQTVQLLVKIRTCILRMSLINLFCLYKPALVVHGVIATLSAVVEVTIFDINFSHCHYGYRGTLRGGFTSAI